MWVTVFIGVRMMLAVNRYPLFRFDARGQPQRQPKEPGHCWVNGQSAMAERSMQIHRCPGIRDCGHNCCRDHRSEQSV
jgi:hypothetical protein